MSGSLEPRAFLHRIRALLTIVFGASLLAAYLLDTRGPRTFIVEMRTDASGYAQLFYDTGSGFTETASVTLPVGASTTYATLSFELPDQYIHAIRFDPINVPATFWIHRAYVIDAKGRAVREFALGDWAATNQILTRAEENAAVRFATTPDANDAALQLTQPAPASALWLSSATLTRGTILIGIALLATIAVAAAGFALQPLAHSARQGLDWAASRVSDPHVFVLDRFAIGCYLAMALVFVVSVAAGFHGSSLSLHADPTMAPEQIQPLLGRGKEIRSDEWAAHTPAILNQVYRARRFAADWSVVGPDSAALIANIPVAHFTTLFRPQFWGFFALPAAYGFSFYWQFKALLLLSGVFSLLLLLTRSSRIAAFGALWYASSSYVQWTYSWASLLPEMVGLFGLVMCSSFYMSVGRRVPLLIVAAIVCVASAVNFALCAYIPHQIPLVWLGVFLCVWWMAANRRTIFARDRWLPRAAALGGAWLLIAVVMMVFYRDAEAAIVTAANTIYPGQRSLPGGIYQMPMWFSHFFAFWTDDRTFPLRETFGNISECAGFFWLAPVSAFALRAAGSGERHLKLAYGTLATFGVLLFVWLTVPLPKAFGTLTLMDKSGVGRSLHVLGLVNVALVAIGLSLTRTTGPTDWRRSLGLATAVFLTLYPIFALTNASLARFLTPSQLLLAAMYFTVVITTLIEGRLPALAALLIAPQIALFGLVNPLDRGLRAVESSPVFELVHAQPELLDGRWIVYSDYFPDSSVFSGVGCEVVTGLRFVPDLESMSVFDLSAEQRSVLNRSGLFLARPSYGTEPVRFELSAFYSVMWHVNPLDPRLEQIGVRYAAFTVPPPASVAARMRLLSRNTVGGFWLFELP